MRASQILAVLECFTKHSDHPRTIASSSSIRYADGLRT